MPRRRVCFVVADVPTTKELDEWGKALLNVVLSMTRDDVEVEILSCAEVAPSETWAHQLDLAGVRVRSISSSVQVSPQEMAKSWRAYRAIRDETFDTIIFQGVGGLGAVSGLARRAGSAFARTRLIEWFRDASERRREREGDVAQYAGGVVTEHMERLAAETADNVVFPDEDSQSWVVDRGWRPDGSCSVLCDIELADLAPEAVTNEMLEGLVVIGGEADQSATDALQAAAARLSCNARVRVSLEAGKAADKFDGPARAALASALGVHETDVEVDLADERTLLQTLRSRTRVGVLMGGDRDMTFLAHELLAGGIPFVVAHGRADGDVGAVGGDPAASWLEMARPITRTAEVDEEPLVTVVVAHHDRPRLVTQAVRSIGLQTYRNLEVVVVDDGSTVSGAQEALDALSMVAKGRPLTLLRQSNRYLGAARNAGVRAANGEFVVFLDDDDLAAPEYCASLVTAAISSGADVVTCAFEMIDQHAAPQGAVMAFLGGPLAVGPVLNVLGGAGMLVRRSVFERVGGFHEEHGVGHEDWQLLVKIALDGGSILAVPEPLYRYRQHPGTMIQDRNLLADSVVVADAFASTLPAALRGWPMTLRGFHEEVHTRGLEVSGLRCRVADLEEELDRRRRYIRVLQRTLARPSSDRPIVSDPCGPVGRTVAVAREAGRRLGHVARGARRQAASADDPARLAARELFDESHYRSQVLLPADEDAFDHFRTTGWRMGLDPHPLFSVRWYLRRPPADGHDDPLTEFVRVGWREDRDPHPLFDVGWYLSTAPDLGQVDPLRDYLADGWRNGRDPHPFFETDRYLRSRRDVRRAQVCPLLHYVTNGWQEDADPSSIFDAVWYVAHQSGSPVPEAMPPYWHYLTIGAARGDLPGPWATSMEQRSGDGQIGATEDEAPPRSSMMSVRVEDVVDA